MSRSLGTLVAVALASLSGALTADQPMREAQTGPEVQQIGNWPAPPYWASPAVRAPGMHSEAASTPPPMPFIGVTPCRQYDARPATLADNTPLAITLTGAPCGIPAAAGAVSLNITVVGITGAGSNGVLRVGTSSPPVTGWINYPPTETQRANAGVLPVNGSGEIFVQVNQGGGTIQVIVDVNGYYAPEANIGTIFNYTGNAGVNSTLAISGATNAAAPNEIRAAGPIPVACTVDTFSVFMDTSPTVLTIFTLQRNANDGNGFLDTNATCQIGVGGNICQAASPSVAFAAGDLAMTSVTGAAGAGGRASVSFRCR